MPLTYVAFIGPTDGAYQGRFPDLIDCVPAYGLTEAEVLKALPSVLDRELDQLKLYGRTIPEPSPLHTLKCEGRGWLVLIHSQERRTR